MSPELIAVITLGIGLAVLITGLFAWLRADMARLESRIRAEFQAVRGEIAAVRGEIAIVRGEVAELKSEVAQLRERMAHLGGLREAMA